MWIRDRSIRENGIIDIHCILHRIVRLEDPIPVNIKSHRQIFWGIGFPTPITATSTLSNIHEF
jgi:hypothetical protein